MRAVGHPPSNRTRRRFFAAARPVRPLPLLLLSALFAAALLATVPAAAFTLAVSQVDLAVAPSFNHTPVRVAVSSSDPGFDVSSLHVSSSAAWVTPSTDGAAGEVVLSFVTSGLINQTNTATITVSLGGETSELIVNATVSPLLVFTLTDDPRRSRMYGIHQNGLQLGSVVVLDPISGDHLGNVTVGRKPCDLALSADGRELLAINSVDESISVVDLVTLAVKETIALPAFDNWGPSETTANIGVGPGAIVYYTDGAWAPVLRVLDRTTLQILQTSTIEPGSSYGFGDFALTSDNSQLFGWMQYGWSAGLASSHMSRYTVGANGLLTFVEKSDTMYSAIFGRDPLETPVLITADDQTVFIKGLAVAASSVKSVVHSYPGPVYSISPGGEIAATATAVYETATGIKVADLPRSAPVQAISSDYGRLVYFDSAAREIKTLNLLELVGPGILNREIVPADRSITLSPERLAWSPLPGIDRFRVYLGLSDAAVAAAGPDSSLLLGEVTTPFCPVPGPLTAGVTYYWRVDAVGEYDVIVGEIFEFTVSTISSSLHTITAATVKGHRSFVATVEIVSLAPGMPWQAGADQPWVTFTQTSGTTPATVEVRLDASGLSPGLSRASVTISSGAVRLFALPVNLTVEPLKLTRIESDPGSSLVYGISEDTANPAARAYLLEIDTLTEAIERVVEVGTSATDLAIHAGDNRIYVPNWLPGSLLAVDRDSFKQVRAYAFAPFAGMGYGDDDVYRVSAGGPGRLVVEEEDQWIDLSIFDTAAGTEIDTAGAREGGGGFDPSGRYYYHGDNNSTGAEIHKFDVIGDQFFELAHVRVATYSYYGSRTVVVSDDGTRVFWNGSVFDANLVPEWAIGDEICAATADGRYAFARKNIYDIDQKLVVGTMPAQTAVSAFNDDTGKLVIQTGTTLGFFELARLLDLVNDAPVLAVVANRTVNEGQLLAFTLTAADADGNALTYSSTALPTGATLNAGTGEFSWTPGYKQAGNHRITFTVTDNGTPSLSDAETITVTVRNVNRAPVLGTVGNRTGEEGQPISFTLSATDPDGNALTYTSTALPAGAALNPTTRVFSWTPTYDQAGTYPITFTVTDNGTPSLSDSESVTVTVRATNRAPVLGAVGNRTVLEGQPLAFTLTAADADGNALTFSATALPPGATLHASTGVFSWRPGYTQGGSYPIIFTVTDNGSPNLQDAEAITVLVSDTEPGPRVKNDFDGDGSSDIGCYDPAGGTWYGFNSTAGFWQTQYGSAGTLPVTGDFDGDGTSDIGYYHPETGAWHISRSSEGLWETQFGYPGTIPVVGDFDGDGRDDIGCYFPPGGNWYVFKSAEGFWQTTFGYTGTIPVVGDFDGDGRDDIGCYYPAGGNWYVFKSTEGFWQTTFGYAGTIPVVGDFDADGRSDIGCYYPQGGNWYLFQSTAGFWQTVFGYAGTEPVVGDFDGDGKSDLGCYYPTGGNWYVFKSAAGFWQTTFGFEGTIPLGGTLR